MNNQKLIGLKIKKARLDANLTQEELGEKSGYSAMGISYFEKGERDIKISNLEKFAEILNVDINFFLEPVTEQTSFPSTSYRRGSFEVTNEQKKEEENALKNFDNVVKELLKKP